MANLIAASEAAKRIGVSPSTVKRWAKDGRLPATSLQTGGRRQWLFAEADVDAAANEQAARVARWGHPERRGRPKGG